MTIYQLNRDELIEVKQRYYSNIHKNISYNEMISIDTLVTDEEIYEEYKDTIFSIDDFFCNTRDDGIKRDNNLDREKEESELEI